MVQPGAKARETIDALLTAARWHLCNLADADIAGHRGVAIREFPLKPGQGLADYLLYIDGKVAGVIEAKKQGVTLSGAETQAAQYTQGLPDGLPAWSNPLPFSYQSTGIETRFTNGLDPEPKARGVFAFHRPETLVEWSEGIDMTGPPLAGGSAKLLQAVAFGNTEDEVLTSLAGRLARIEHGICAADDAKIRTLSGGLSLKDLAHRIIQSLDPDFELPSPESAGLDPHLTPSAQSVHWPHANLRPRIFARHPGANPGYRGG